MIALAALSALLLSPALPARALAAPPALASMSGLGGGDDKRVDVPITPELFKGTVTDSTLTDTTLDEISMDGYTHVQGELGAGVVSIRFEDIAKVDFEPGEKGKSIALVFLKNGQTKKIVVDGKTPIYGKTGFGNYKVLVKDTKRLVIESGPVKREQRDVNGRVVSTPRPSAP